MRLRGQIRLIKSKSKKSSITLKRVVEADKNLKSDKKEMRGKEKNVNTSLTPIIKTVLLNQFPNLNQWDMLRNKEISHCVGT